MDYQFLFKSGSDARDRYDDGALFYMALSSIALVLVTTSDCGPAVPFLAPL
ncbi:hypothetical protein [Halopseudomonas pelagia]|uniref:hypothetical protein n=1 Tax=Halopseudomonas pelagia TaxID=553151 RepID=UPI0030DAEDB2|tara:strand:+ start:1406 stop:1558 length:153 start_codon:yes stop_codon:yes gene_type:complete